MKSSLLVRFIKPLRLATAYRSAIAMERTGQPVLLESALLKPVEREHDQNTAYQYRHLSNGSLEVVFPMQFGH